MRSSLSSKKRTKTIHILIKTNSFVRFLGESSALQFVFEINWPLGDNFGPIFTKNVQNDLSLFSKDWTDWKYFSSLFHLYPLKNHYIENSIWHNVLKIIQNRKNQLRISHLYSLQSRWTPNIESPKEMVLSLKISAI